MISLLLANDIMLFLRRAWSCQAELNEIAKTYADLTARKEAAEKEIAAVRGSLAEESSALETCLADQSGHLEQIKKLEAIRDRTRKVMEYH